MSSSLFFKTFLFIVLKQLIVTSSQDVWPKPQQIKVTPSDVYILDPVKFNFVLDPQSPKDCQTIHLAFKRYMELTFDQSCRKWSPEVTNNNHVTDKVLVSASDNSISCGDNDGFVSSSCQENRKVRSLKQLNNLTISYRFCESFPYEGMDETYTLFIGSKAKGNGILFADTVWGVLRGLESFSQLVYREEFDYKVQATAILDFPRFPYRGLMFDTSRHFIPVDVIKQNLDAMAYNKFNVFHWHLVDDQSFPYESKKYPELHEKGAYNPRTHIYTQDQVKEIIEYARIRGIRVIPEFDTPGHTQSWGKSGHDILTVCYGEDGEPSGTFGPLDPSRESTYIFLEEFYKELKTVFPDSVVHLGGDEVDFECWKSNPHITKFMEANGIKSYEALENYYIQRLIEIVDKLDKKMIVWQEVFDNHVTLHENKTVVHVWKGYNDDWRWELGNVTKAGKRAILSSPYYLNDIVYGIDWPKFYTMEPISFNGTDEENERVIGGSVCMWTEFVDGTGIMPRTWPRASAVAERLWSSAEVNDPDAAVSRIKQIQCLMRRRGLRVEPINGPGFCQCDHLIN